MADEEKESHEKLYPGYKCAPRKSNEIKKRKTMSKKSPSPRKVGRKPTSKKSSSPSQAGVTQQAMPNYGISFSQVAAQQIQVQHVMVPETPYAASTSAAIQAAGNVVAPLGHQQSTTTSNGAQAASNLTGAPGPQHSTATSFETQESASTTPIHEPHKTSAMYSKIHTNPEYKDLFGLFEAFNASLEAGALIHKQVEKKFEESFAAMTAEVDELEKSLSRYFP